MFEVALILQQAPLRERQLVETVLVTYSKLSFQLSFYELIFLQSVSFIENIYVLI